MLLFVKLYCREISTDWKSYYCCELKFEFWCRQSGVCYNSSSICVRAWLVERHRGKTYNARSWVFIGYNMRCCPYSSEQSEQLPLHYGILKLEVLPLLQEIPCFTFWQTIPGHMQRWLWKTVFEEWRILSCQERSPDMSSIVTLYKHNDNQIKL